MVTFFKSFVINFRRVMIILILLWMVGITQVAFGAIVVGNSQGSVTLTEVMDYQCDHCHRMQPVIHWLMAHNPSLKVRIIPVAIINKASLIEASSSYVMAKTTRYFLKYHTLLMSRAVTARDVAAILNQWPVNLKMFRSDMHQPWVLKEMESGLALLKQYHSGTPLIVIYPSNNTKRTTVFRGETDPQTLIHAIREASK